MDRNEQQVDTKAYWAANLRLTISLLCIWFIVSYGAGIATNLDSPLWC